MVGLTKITLEVLQRISDWSYLKEYTFIGGSALAVQINHRLSEDLDFCKWKRAKNEKRENDVNLIDNYLNEIGVLKKDLLSFQMVNYVLSNKIKLSFYANNNYKSPVSKTVKIHNNIISPSIDTIGAMKLELMLRRSNFRDYYDIYPILREGVSLSDMVGQAKKYSNYILSTKNILYFISNGENYKMEKEFERLQPKYQVNEKDIEKYIKHCIHQEFNRSSNAKPSA